MKSTLWWLGLIFGTLSVVMLIKHGFEVSFVSSFQIVLDYYEQATHFLFGWAEKWINGQLASWRNWIGWDLQLYPHWKHVFVLMWLYFGADARNAWKAGAAGYALFALLWGGLVALVSGVGAGTVALDSAVSNMLMAAWPVVGIVVHGLGDKAWNATLSRREGWSWWGQFVHTARFPLYRGVVGGAVLALGTQVSNVPYLNGLPNPGLAALAVLIIALALYWMWDGARSQRGEGDTWRQKFLGDRNTQLGLAMLGTIAAAGLFIATNAGLKLAGL